MRPVRSETTPVRTESDILLARRIVREWAMENGLSILEVTKIVTAVSEIARNTVIHGGGGTMLLEAFAEGERRGVRLTFEDKGSGIADVERAMTDGFTTGGGGLGFGLGGAKRLVDEFKVVSRVGEGTRVTVTQWT